ncbi:MAG: copper ion binding protein [Salinivirgaceae bacterium]|nr:copper ion binding protein [Salinivirgaceae bacterium]
MKNMTKILIIALIATTSTTSFSQNKEVKKVMYECDIDCISCKENIMKNIPYEKGIKNISIDLDQKLVTVDFKEGKNTSEGIRKAIEKLGYSSIILGTANTFSVNGNCGMCKEKIEAAAIAVNGVSKASWNIDQKMLTVAYDETKINIDSIQKAIANVGYDTDIYKASDDVYNKLPSCCKYDR